MTWRWRLRPLLGALAVVAALAGAVHADRVIVPLRAPAPHPVSDVAAVHPLRLPVAEALPAPVRTAAVRHGSRYWGPSAVLPTAAALAAAAFAALVAAAVRGRRLVAPPTRYPPRAPPVAGTPVPGHGAGRGLLLTRSGCGALVPG